MAYFSVPNWNVHIRCLKLLKKIFFSPPPKVRWNFFRPPQIRVEIFSPPPKFLGFLRFRVENFFAPPKLRQIFFRPPQNSSKFFSPPPRKRVEIFLTPTPIGPGGVPHNWWSFPKGASINHMTPLREGGGQLECQRGVIREGGGQWECHMTIYFTFCQKKNKYIKKIIIFK